MDEIDKALKSGQIDALTAQQYRVVYEMAQSETERQKILEDLRHEQNWE